MVTTAAGDLAFQDYLVRRRARPRVLGVRYRGARAARPAAGVLEAIARSKTVILAPSNPFVSLGPILAVPGIRTALRQVRERVVAVSPLIGGRAIKGPLASMLRSMRPGVSSGNLAIASMLRDVAATFVVARDETPVSCDETPGSRGETSVSCGNTPGGRGPKDVTFVEHDILLLDPKRAAALARFVVSRTGKQRSNA
jgi:2-phospho-L-lactate transferase